MPQKIFLCAVVFLSALAEAASYRPQVGLGYTSNANYEDTSEDSDLFWQAKFAGLYMTPKYELSVWAGIKDYANESQNDIWNWRLGLGVPKKMFRADAVTWNMALGGQNYLEDAPATTEESFDFVYAETSLLIEETLTAKTGVTSEPGFQIKRYSHFAGRTDFTLFVENYFEWFLKESKTLSPSLDIGFVSSSDELYTRRYIEIGVMWVDTKFLNNLRFTSRYTLRQTSFPNRLVSQATAISRGRGSALGSRDVIETQSFSQLSGSVTKFYNKNELTGTIVLNSQNSKSGVEEYSELVIMASLLVPL
jgi:hypothetical protein